MCLQVIQGIDLAVALMDLGEISQMEIGPRFAYGSQGNGKDIPADATILYTVELLQIEKEKDLEDVTINERLQIGYIYTQHLMLTNISCNCFDFLNQQRQERTRQLVVQSWRFQLIDSMLPAGTRLSGHGE